MLLGGGRNYHANQCSFATAILFGSNAEALGHSELDAPRRHAERALIPEQSGLRRATFVVLPDHSVPAASYLSEAILRVKPKVWLSQANHGKREGKAIHKAIPSLRPADLSRFS